MPLIFRAMHVDGNHPKCGPDAKMLGVRVYPTANHDVKPDGEGQVEPGGGGMSVAPDAAKLPVHRLPRRLRSRP